MLISLYFSVFVNQQSYIVWYKQQFTVANLANIS